MKTTLFAFLVLVSLSHVMAGDPVAFEPLPVGDLVHVTFHSSGCFNSSTYEFDFQRGAAVVVHITRLDERWNDKKKRLDVVGRTPQGSVTLTAKEMARLDRLFAFYRTNPQGLCTTKNRITAIHKRGAATLATETFTDATCSTDEMKGVMTFHQVLAKLYPEGK